MDKFEYVKQALKDRKIHKEIVFKAEVSQSTLWNILNGVGTQKPMTINTIYNYLKKSGR